MTAMKAILLIMVPLAAAAGIGGGWALWHHTDRSDAGEPSAPAANPDWIAANGTIEGARPNVAIRSEITGTLATLNGREDQEVAQGQVLAELVNETHKHQVALAVADVAIARAQLDRLRNGERAEKRRSAAATEDSKRAMYQQAQADWERVHKLTGKQSVSREQTDSSYYRMQRAGAEYEQAKAEHALVDAPARADELAAAEGRVAAAEAKLQLARAELAKTRLLAPCPGRILQVYAEPGEIVCPTSAKPILLLANLSKRRVRAFVEELDAARVRAGQRAVSVIDGFLDVELSGKVGTVLPYMGRRTPQADTPGEYKDLYFREVLIDLDSSNDLPVNLRVRTRIQINSEPKSHESSSGAGVPASAGSSRNSNNRTERMQIF
jgi:multidrug resistance efflux pump